MAVAKKVERAEYHLEDWWIDSSATLVSLGKTLNTELPSLDVFKSICEC